MINSAIERAIKIPRCEALKKVVKQKSQDRPVFALVFDPRLPSVSKIIQKHYRTMVTDPYLAETFPLPPLIAYKKQKNIREKLIR